MGIGLILCWLLASPLAAQQRPFRTVDAETLPAGWMRVGVGFDFFQDVTYPLSGLSGDLTSAGVLGARLALGRLVEVQLEGTVRNFLDVQKQDPGFVTLALPSPRSTNDVGDFALFTKFRILKETERRPGIAVRFGFEMPNSNQARGIGTNTTNIFLSGIVQKHIGRLNLMGNLGLGILEAPNANSTQNDVLTYGGAFAYRLHRRVEFLGEVAGHHSTRTITAALVGTESRSQARYGVKVLAGGFQWDFAGVAGLTRRDARTGFTFGISREFRLFDYGSVK